MSEFSATKADIRYRRDLEELGNEDDDLIEDDTENKTDKPKQRKSSRKRKKDEIEPKFLDMYSSIYSMRQELDRIRKPVGTRENPVRTCKDLYYGHPQFNDGEFSVLTA